jgi:hypothetical protein
VLSVADNGVGIRNGLNGRAAAFGLLGMHERAIMLGGMFEVTGGPGGVGTTITARVPHSGPPAGQASPGAECCDCASAAAATAKVRGRTGRRASGYKRRCQ